MPSIAQKMQFEKKELARGRASEKVKVKVKVRAFEGSRGPGGVGGWFDVVRCGMVTLMARDCSRHREHAKCPRWKASLLRGKSECA
jgi:hypothetical protein